MGDHRILIVTEISRSRQSTSEVIDLISLRAKEALAAKKVKGIWLGKLVGTIQKSKYDVHRETITQWLELGLSLRKIAKNLGFPNHNSLAVYIRKRNLKDTDVDKTKPIG